jgi:hypothetical protein
MLENLFNESSSSSSDNEDDDNDDEENINKENNLNNVDNKEEDLVDNEKDREGENFVPDSPLLPLTPIVISSSNNKKYEGHARAKSLIQQFKKRKEVRPSSVEKKIPPSISHLKDNEFNDVREYVRDLMQENTSERMSSISSKVIERTGTCCLRCTACSIENILTHQIHITGYTLPQPRPHVLGDNVGPLKTRRQKRKLLESIAPVLVEMEKHNKVRVFVSSSIIFYISDLKHCFFFLTDRAETFAVCITNEMETSKRRR